MSEHRGRIPGSSSNRQRGCSVAITGKAQKQGSAEADPVGRKKSMTLLSRNYYSKTIIIFVKYIKNSIIHYKLIKLSTGLFLRSLGKFQEEFFSFLLIGGWSPNSYCEAYLALPCSILKRIESPKTPWGCTMGRSSRNVN